jgi:hypothetical protein
MDGARDFASRLAYRDFLPATEDALVEAVGRVVTFGTVETTVCEHEGRIVAGLGLSFVPHLWNPNVTLGEELFWWAAPGAPPAAALMLIRAARRRIAEREALPLFKALANSPAALDRVYRAIGLSPVETSYA